tara:strand:- start:2156 stop:3259 length:1104 start_codon:yes stop_codon:yes gene_type:complete
MIPGGGVVREMKDKDAKYDYEKVPIPEQKEFDKNKMWVRPSAMRKHSHVALARGDENNTDEKEKDKETVEEKKPTEEDEKEKDLEKAKEMLANGELPVAGCRTYFTFRKTGEEGAVGEVETVCLGPGWTDDASGSYMRGKLKIVKGSVSQTEKKNRGATEDGFAKSGTLKIDIVDDSNDLKKSGQEKLEVEFSDGCPVTEGAVIKAAGCVNCTHMGTLFGTYEKDNDIIFWNRLPDAPPSPPQKWIFNSDFTLSPLLSRTMCLGRKNSAKGDSQVMCLVDRNDASMQENKIIFDFGGRNFQEKASPKKITSKDKNIPNSRLYKGTSSSTLKDAKNLNESGMSFRKGILYAVIIVPCKNKSFFRAPFP